MIYYYIIYTKTNIAITQNINKFLIWVDKHKENCGLIKIKDISNFKKGYDNEYGVFYYTALTNINL